MSWAAAKIRDRRAFPGLLDEAAEQCPIERLTRQLVAEADRILFSDGVVAPANEAVAPGSLHGEQCHTVAQYRQRTALIGRGWRCRPPAAGGHMLVMSDEPAGRLITCAPESLRQEVAVTEMDAAPGTGEEQAVAVAVRAGGASAFSSLT